MFFDVRFIFDKMVFDPSPISISRFGNASASATKYKQTLKIMMPLFHSPNIIIFNCIQFIKRYLRPSNSRCKIEDMHFENLILKCYLADPPAGLVNSLNSPNE